MTVPTQLLTDSQLPTAHIKSVPPEHAGRLEITEVNEVNNRLANLAIDGHFAREYQDTVELGQKATHDTEHMSQLLNREGMKTWFERYRPENAGVMLLDVRGFKKINDLFGQHVGDAVLSYVGEKFMQRIRIHNPEQVKDDRRQSQQGVNKDAAAGRVGGDEFAVVINLDDVPEAERENLMKAIVERLSNFDTYDHEGKDINISIRSAFKISNDKSELFKDIYEKLGQELKDLKQQEKATEDEAIQPGRRDFSIKLGFDPNNWSRAGQRALGLFGWNKDKAA